MRLTVGLLSAIFVVITCIRPLPITPDQIDPGILLKKADEAAAIDPDRAMDLSESVLLFLKGSDDEYLEIKARLIIGKSLYYKGKIPESFKTLSNVKARISMFSMGEKSMEMSLLFAESFFWIGEVYQKMNRYKKSLESYFEGLGHCDPEKSGIIRSKLTISIARTFLMLSEYEKAMEYAIKGAKSAPAGADTESGFFSQYYQGYIYRELKEYDKGMIKFKAALDIAETKKRTDLKIMALNEISNISLLRKNIDNALQVKKEALKLADQTGNSSALSFCLHDIALIFIEKGAYKQALPYLTRSRNLAVENSNVRGQIITDLTIADTYFRLGNVKKSLEIAESTVKNAEEHGLKSALMDASEFLSRISAGQKKYKDAYTHLKRSFDLNQAVFSVNKSTKIAELEAEIDMEKSESRILLLEKINEIKQLELEKQNKVITMQRVTTFLIIIIAFLIFLAYRWKMKANLQLRKKSEELEKTITEIHQLSGLLPICSSCKKIRDDSGYWHQVEEYIKSHSDASFSHSMCPSCIERIYPKRRNGKKSPSGRRTTVTKE